MKIVQPIQKVSHVATKNSEHSIVTYVKQDQFESHLPELASHLILITIIANKLDKINAHGFKETFVVHAQNLFARIIRNSSMAKLEVRICLPEMRSEQVY